LQCWLLPDGVYVRANRVVAVGWLAIATRIALGCVFLLSSAGKIANPDAFAVIVANYQLLPTQLVWATAVVLPWIEAVCGLALIAGRYQRGAALLVSLMMVAFICIILYNGYRGLDVACGCFSLSARAPSNITLNTLRNLVILAAGVWILIRSERRLPAGAR
jgi:uncharacterized membrane protein YphA (DoxX/SURF4 family)